MTVFIAQGWMRWPLRCRARELADYGWNVREPRAEGDQTPARIPAKRVSAKPGYALRSAQARSRGGRTVQVHVRAAVRPNQAACRQKRQFLGTCSRSAKSIRVRNAGVSCVRGCFVCRVLRHTRPRGHPRGAAGAVKRPVVPHAPSGEEEQGGRRVLEPDKTQGDDARLHL